MTRVLMTAESAIHSLVKSRGKLRIHKTAAANVCRWTFNDGVDNLLDSLNFTYASSSLAFVIEGKRRGKKMF